MKKERETPIQAQLIFELFQRVGEEGMTSNEVAAELDLPASSVSTRISQLRRACCVAETPLLRTLNGTGPRSTVYQITPQASFDRYIAYTKKLVQPSGTKPGIGSQRRLDIQGQISTEVSLESVRSDQGVDPPPSHAKPTEPKLAPAKPTAWEDRVLKAADAFRRDPSKRNRKYLLTVSRFMV